MDAKGPHGTVVQTGHKPQKTCATSISCAQNAEPLLIKLIMTTNPHNSVKPQETAPETAATPQAKTIIEHDPFAAAISAAGSELKVEVENAPSNTFTGLKCANIAKAALSAITGTDGNPVAFSDDEIKAWQAPFYATVPNKEAVLRVILAKHSIPYNDDFLKLMKEFFNPATVQKKIKAAADKPKTGIKDLL